MMLGTRTNDIGGGATIAISAGGSPAGEIDAIGERVGSGQGAEIVVVAGVC